MPNTSNYGFDYESPTSLPGTTLTGGPTTTMPVLAVQVDAVLASLSNTVSDQASEIASLGVAVDAIQTNVTNLTNWNRRNSVSVSFTSMDAFTVPVNFGFTFPGLPTIMTNIDSGSGTTGRWDSRAILPTTTGFTLFVFSNASGSAGTWVDIPVSWTALYRA